MITRILLFFVAFSTFANATVLEMPISYGTQLTDMSEEYFERGLMHLSEYKILDKIKNFPDDPSGDKAEMLRAELDLVAGNLSVADSRLAEFAKTRTNSPFVPFALIQRGFIAFKAKKFEKAEKHFTSAKVSSLEAFRTRNDSDYYHNAHISNYLLALSLSQQGKHLDAIPVLFDGVNNLSQGEYTDDSYFLLGRIHEINRNYDSALVYYRIIENKYPGTPVMLVSLVRTANSNIALRKPTTALVALERAGTLHRKLQTEEIGFSDKQNYFVEDLPEQISFLKGESYNLAKNYTEADREFNYLLEKYPNSEFRYDALNSLGWALMNLERYDDAISKFDLVINSDSELSQRAVPVASLYRAVSLKRAGKLEQARREFSALGMQPAYPFLGLVLLEVGQMQYEAREFDQAMKTLERAARETQDARTSVRISLVLGATYIEMKLWERATGEFKKAELLAENANDVTMPNRDYYLALTRLNQGITLVKARRATEAIPYLQAYIAENKDGARTDEALFWLGEAYFRTDLLRNSIEAYDNLLNRYPMTIRKEEAMYGLGWSHFRLRDFNNSSRVFDNMIREFPKSKYAVEVLTRQGDGYYLDKSFGKAADSYRRAAKMSPGTEEGQYASYQLAHALYRNNSWEQSITSLLDFVRLYGRSPYAPNSLYLIGWIRFQQKKYTEAIDNFHFLINAYAQSTLVPRAYYAIGDAYYNMGEFEKSIENYKIVIESYPGSQLAPEAIRSVQYSLMALGRESEAIEIANKYVATNPESPFAPVFQKKIGEMFYQGGKFKDAIAEYERFVAKNPNNENVPEVLYMMAKSYSSLNETDQAEQMFSKIVREHPQSEYAPMSLLEGGLLQIELANIQKADSLLRHLQITYPENEYAGQAGFERAVIKYRIGDTTSSLAIFEEIATKYKDNDWGDQSRYRIAMHYRTLEQYDSARHHFEFIADIEDNPKISSESRYRIGELWMRDKNYIKAIESFLIVKDKFEGYEDWYSQSLLNLGESYENLEQFDFAREIYRVLEIIRPDDDYGKTAKSRLNRIKNK
ncbi:MAG: hypothetical protein CVV22_08720 [Ignavibacteriae bacterium HGW-Ignavibacteriae-1]|jgi:TolA-binding protein|nr:MAG: hypothetical protein CVV22_08720 [Ignavibacteriae bacterium HGW-Ignavibacteriae-1]